MPTSLQIANTIAQQLGGQRRLKVMAGATDFVAIERGLQFHLPSNFAKDKINNVRVVLADNDTYTVEFGVIGRRKPDYTYPFTVLETTEGVYADMLPDVVAKRTGLDLSM